MKNVLTLLFIALSLQSCGQDKFKYSDKETEQFLIAIAKNAKTEISFITENEKKPTDNFLLVSRFPLSEKHLEEYNKNGTIKNTFNDLPDFTTFTFKSYELVNEKKEKVNLVENAIGDYLQKFALWKYNGILFHNVGIEITLNRKFEKLNGFIIIEFEMPNGMKKETKILVNISIFDKVTEE
ncbi:hypothetical protein [Flavobacterium weaverense]|uniref:Lipoprotein n=1 Tax=Flavobacterium weaverense TaxID=271156 RepID=A0A3M0A0Q6_9FLAO|nr:hypothetical protein [Flavobacterium weaverense]RMA72562.1 hypothetical protein BC961_2965 [Flavobacterium weaverense]